MNTHYAIALTGTDVIVDIVVRKDGTVSHRGRYADSTYLGPWSSLKRNGTNSAAHMLRVSREKGWQIVREVV